MTDILILLAIPGGEILLTPEELHAARLRAHELAGSLLQPGLPTSRGTEVPPVASDTLLDAAAMAAATGVPASWFLSAARKGLVPAVLFGRYPRFNLADVTQAMRRVRKSGASNEPALQLPPSQRLSRAKRNGYGARS